jgi:hypothetical protein
VESRQYQSNLLDIPRGNPYLRVDVIMGLDVSMGLAMVMDADMGMHVWMWM